MSRGKRELLGALVAAALLAAAIVFLPAEHAPAPAPTVARSCPQVLGGHGAMGACAPASAGLRAAPPLLTPGAITYPDRSNNDPTENLAGIRRAGHPGIVLKVNQGTGFVDGWFHRMSALAKAQHLAVGGYDFDQNYTAAEVYVFVSQLHAAGIWRGTPNTFPPTLDIESGNPSRAGVLHQLVVLFREYGRADIYSGGWFWLPHFGCWWPAGVPAWLSGYPTASVFCGLSERLFAVHQYSDHGYDGAGPADMNVWRGSASSFHAFIQTPTPQPPKPAPNVALKRALALRAQLRVLLTRRRCRVVHGRRAYRACPVWAREGQAVNRLIDRLHHEGIH